MSGLSYNGYVFNAADEAGLQDSFNNLKSTQGYSGTYNDFLKSQGITTGLTPTQELSMTPGLFGITNGQWDNMGQMAGLAGSAYNIYDSLFGNKADLYKEQIGALKDQRAYNKEMLENHRTFNKNIGAGLASAFSK